MQVFSSEVFTLKKISLKYFVSTQNFIFLNYKTMQNTALHDEYYDTILNNQNSTKDNENLNIHNQTNISINTNNQKLLIDEFLDNTMKDLKIINIINYFKNALFYKLDIIPLSSNYRTFNCYNEVFIDDIIDFELLKNAEKIYIKQEYTRNNEQSEYLERWLIERLEKYLLQNEAIKTKFIEKYDTGNCLYFEVYINPYNFFNLLSLIYYNWIELRYWKKYIRIEWCHKKLIDYFLDKQNADMIDVENYVFSNHKIIQRLGYFIDDEKIKNLLKNINKIFKKLCYPTSFFTLNTWKIIKKANYIEENIFTK